MCEIKVMEPRDFQEQETNDKIRVELNLEKWPIWKLARSKSKPVARFLNREITLQDGTKAKASVEVGYTQRGELTTEDQKTLYALIKHWESNGCSDELVFISKQKLAKLKKKKWGSNVSDSDEESLVRLRTTPIIWKNSYYDSNTKSTLELLEPFTILSDLKLVKKKESNSVSKIVSYYKFHPFILQNLKANHTKPLWLDVVLSFKTDLALAIYTHIDLIMADKWHYQRRSQELFEDLEIKGDAYKYASDRKRQLERAIKELEEKPLSTGRLISVLIEQTKDRLDYKVVFKKGVLREGKEQISEIDNDKALTLEEIFLSCFFNTFKVKHKKGTTKELVQAKELIKAHQLSVKECKYIIEFALSAAKETSYKPQYFGGIIQYVEDAIAHYRNNGKDNANANKQNSSKECELCKFTEGYLYLTYENEQTDRISCPHNQQVIDELKANTGFTVGLK